jgi:hypothetical protein
MATNSALLTSHILANRCESSAPGGIRTPNPQIRSHDQEQTPETSDDLPEKKSGNGS